MNIVDEPLDPNTLYADGFEDALIGLGWRCASLVAVYSYTKCVGILMSEGLTHEEAVEHMEFNVVGAYVGDYTPVFLMDDCSDCSDEKNPTKPGVQHD